MSDEPDFVTAPRTVRDVAIVLIAAALAMVFVQGCPWMANDHCAPNTTRCAPRRHVPQVCGPAGSTRWVDVQDCPATSTRGEPVVCCYVVAPERNFSGHACVPRARCTEPPAF